MGAITNIFREYSPEYLTAFPGLPVQHQKVISAIVNCRSEAYGVTIYRCEDCGED
ncbi:MAG: transposase zinc-binding domain-containing protein [Thermodesulfobacteriota bacterium]|nr:transposase zinc-binding domain-containing protein [Thermodesulfobacteriota bacterium]